MASWLATGPPVRVWLPPVRVCMTVVAGEVLDDAEDDRARTPPPARSAAAPAPRCAPGRRRSCRPGRRSRVRGQAAGERRRDGHADRRAHEVLDGQPGHLHEVADRGLAGVPLPVGVGHEADRGVPGALGREGGEAERERQVLLEPAEPEQHQDADQAEAEHRHGVAAPVLVGVGVDAQHAVRRALDRQVPVAGVDVRRGGGRAAGRSGRAAATSAPIWPRADRSAHHRITGPGRRRAGPAPRTPPA